MSEETMTRSEKQRRPQYLYLPNRLAASMAVAASKRDTIVHVRIPVKKGRTVGHIVETNTIRFHTAQDGMATTIEMLSAHVSGGPVLDEQRRYVESISQFDILKALEAGEDSNSLTAVELMIRDSIRGHDHAHGRQALTERPCREGTDGAVTCVVARHDLLRASIGLAGGSDEHLCAD